MSSDDDDDFLAPAKPPGDQQRDRELWDPSASSSGRASDGFFKSQSSSESDTPSRIPPENPRQWVNSKPPKPEKKRKKSTRKRSVSTDQERLLDSADGAPSSVDEYDEGMDADQESIGDGKEDDVSSVNEFFGFPVPAAQKSALLNSPIGRFLAKPVVLLVFLTVLALVNYYDRGAFTGAVPELKDEFNLTNTETGVIGGAFIVGYSLTSPFMAHLSRYLPTGVILGFGMLFWLMATVATGFANGFWSLTIARCISGVGEAAFVCLAPSLIDDAAPPEQRSRWLALFFSALPIGYALGFLGAGTFFHLEQDWSWIFWSEAIVVAPMVFLCLFLPDIQQGDRHGQGKQKSFMESLKMLALNSIYVLMTLGYAAQTFVFGALAYWLPDYVKNQYDLPISTTDFIVGITSLFCGVLGNVFASVLMDYLVIKRQMEKNFVGITLSLVCLILAIPFAFLAIFAADVKIFLVLVSLGEFMMFCTVTPVNATFLSSVTEDLRAHSMAIATLCIHLFGDLSSPTIFGAISDNSNQQTALGFLVLWLGWCVLFWGIAFILIRRKNRVAHFISI